MTPQPFGMAEVTMWITGMSAGVIVAAILLHVPLQRMEERMLEWLERKEREEENR